MAGLVTLIGRLCFVAIFGWAISDYLLNWPARVQMLLEQTGAEPWVAEGLLGGALVLLGLGVLSIAIGLLARWGALLIVIFLIPTTLLFHDFWNLSGAAQAEQLPHFYKNLGLIGGALLIAGLGPGPWALDRWREHLHAKRLKEMQPVTRFERPL